MQLDDCHSLLWLTKQKIHWQDNKEYLQSFQGFNLASKLETEKSILKYGNSCEDANAVIISYDRCSAEFISLWQQAAKSMQVFDMKKIVEKIVEKNSYNFFFNRPMFASKALPPSLDEACSYGLGLPWATCSKTPSQHSACRTVTWSRCLGNGSSTPPSSAVQRPWTPLCVPTSQALARQAPSRQWFHGWEATSIHGEFFFNTCLSVFCPISASRTPL